MLSCALGSAPASYRAQGRRQEVCRGSASGRQYEPTRKRADGGTSRMMREGQRSPSTRHCGGVCQLSAPTANGTRYPAPHGNPGHRTSQARSSAIKPAPLRGTASGAPRAGLSLGEACPARPRRTVRTTTADQVRLILVSPGAECAGLPCPKIVQLASAASRGPPALPIRAHSLYLTEVPSVASIEQTLRHTWRLAADSNDGPAGGIRRSSARTDRVCYSRASQGEVVDDHRVVPDHPSVMAG